MGTTKRTVLENDHPPQNAVISLSAAVLVGHKTQTGFKTV